MQSYREFIGFRATPSDRKKLEFLARRTNRRISDVLRLLVRQAVLADQPDIQLADGRGNSHFDQPVPGGVNNHERH